MMCCADKYFFRQCIVLFTVMLQSFSTGGMLGFPSVLNPEILNTNTTDIKATASQASWIGSIPGTAGFIGFFFSSPIMQLFGRKAVIITNSSVLAIGWIVICFASSIPQIFAGRIIQGLSMGGIFINSLVIAEYVTPRRRGYFTTIQKIFLCLGTFVCHSLALCCTWRQISAIFSVPAMLSVFITFFCTESPYFLAFKGHFEKCESSFHWLNGRTKRNKELQDLLTAQRTSRQSTKSQSRFIVNTVLQDLARRDYQKSFLIVAILTVTMDFSGINYFKAYVVLIMSKLIVDKSIAMYCSILGSSLTIVALCLSSVLVRCVSRRLFILSSTAFCISIMYSLSLVLFLQSKWSGLAWLPSLLVLLINFVVHLGIGPLCFIIIGEIFPLDLKGIGSFTTGIVFTLSYATILKLTPIVIEHLGVCGQYGIFGTFLLFCVIPLFYILPETKDQTLLEIEDTIKSNGTNVDKHELVLLQK